MNMKVTTERFLREAKLIHGDRYDYPKDLDVVQIETSLSITCKKHNITFTSSFRRHITAKQGCAECGKDVGRLRSASRKGTKEQFVARARIVHGDTYDYSQVVYNDCKTKVAIACPKHGTFDQTPNMHLSNRQGCPECYADRRHILAGGYKRLLAMKHDANMGILYVLRFFCDDESFLKIGITSRNVIARWGKTKHMGYQLEVLYENSMPICSAYNIEQYCISQLSEESVYQKDRLRNGNTECFIDTPELVEKLLALIKEQ